jgi:putative nucleotidyltransferase-like protein
VPAHGTPWDPVHAAATSIIVDAAAAEATAALNEAGIRSILLKGASFDRWLYDEREPRMYGDVDLLVAGRAFEYAGTILERLGYRERAEELAPTHVDHAKLWLRTRDGMHVDLHRTLVGIEAEPEKVWAVLTEQTERMEIGGGELEVLAEPARALQVALHATVHAVDDEPKPLLDLSRALERASPGTWEAAAALARRLDAEGAFAAGLEMVSDGRELAARLELTSERSIETAMFAESVPYSSWTVNRLANTPGVLPKLRIALRRVFPEPDFMRAWYPIARRGRLGLALSYPRRLAWLVKATGPAVAGWLRARRRARESG